MSIATQLAKEAEDLVSRLDRKAAKLDAEYLEAEKRAANLKAERDAARLAPKRLADYTVKLGVNYQCPRCWIERETRSALSSIPSTTGDDRLRCDRCHYEIAIEWK